MRRPVERPSTETPKKQKPPTTPSAPPAPPRGQAVAQHDPAAELHAKRLWVEDLARRGLSLDQIERRAPERRPVPLDTAEVRRIYLDYCERVKELRRQGLEFDVALQVERLHSALADAHAGEPVLYQGTPVYVMQRLPNGREERVMLRKKNGATITAIESLLADITGSRKAQRLKIEGGLNLNHTVATNVTRVVESMSPEELEKLRDEQRQLERDAEAYRLGNGSRH